MPSFNLGVVSPSLLKTKFQRTATADSSISPTTSGALDPSWRPPKHDLARVAFKGLYPPGTPLSLSHLTPYEIGFYTSLLTRPRTYLTDEQYKQRTANLIKGMPHDMMNPIIRPLAKLPQSTLTKVAAHFGNAQSVPPAAHLCPHHSRLNGQIIASALCYVEHEIEDHLPDLLESIGGLDNLRPEARYLIKAAEDIMALRINDREFCYFYKRSPPQRYLNSYTKCQACILTQVGSERDVLIALRALSLSRLPKRMKERTEQSMWRVWIEHWMSAYARGQSLNHKPLFDLMMKRSDIVEKELRGLRDGDDITICWSPGLFAWPKTPISTCSIPSPKTPLSPHPQMVHYRATTLLRSQTLPTLSEYSEPHTSAGVSPKSQRATTNAPLISTMNPQTLSSASGAPPIPRRNSKRLVPDAQASNIEEKPGAESAASLEGDSTVDIVSPSACDLPNSILDSPQQQVSSSIARLLGSVRASGWPATSPTPMDVNSPFAITDSLFTRPFSHVSQVPPPLRWNKADQVTRKDSMPPKTSNLSPLPQACSGSDVASTIHDNPTRRRLPAPLTLPFDLAHADPPSKCIFCPHESSDHG